MLLNIIILCFLIVFCNAEYEGDSCLRSGLTGTCVKIGDCPSALSDIHRRREDPKICGFIEAVPIVCCTDNNNGNRINSYKPLITTTSTKRPPQTDPVDYEPLEYEYEYIESRIDGCQPIPAATANKTGRKAFDKCIEYQERLVYPCKRGVAITGEPSRSNNCHHKGDELIFGGEDASKDEFPHMALLRYGENEEDQLWYCGGALISDRFVLTAGHCTSTSKQVAVTHVVIGILARSEESSANRYKVKRIITHPEYISPHKYHDIALLEINKVKLSQFIVPACLHIGDPVNDDKVLATGWGIMDNRGSLADVLQRVILQKFTIEECTRAFIPHRHMQRGIDSQTQVCYGDRSKPRDTCQGDSGGPIQIKSKKIHCMYVIVGVTSVGKECGFVGEPAIYTSLSYYVPWIESIVWP